MRQEQNHYHKIAAAIRYIDTHFKQQPSLDEIAQQIHVSPYHFQRMFTEWAGVSPKKYLQFITLNYAKSCLESTQQSVLETAYDAGLSSGSRLHELFVQIEGMTPATYKQGGKNLTIKYRFAESPFGEMLVASTQKGICHLGFVEKDVDALAALKQQLPEARYIQAEDAHQDPALALLQGEQSDLQSIKLHLKGTAFQIKVWQALLSIPQGGLSSYGEIAQRIGNNKASRAVGSAIGANPIAFLIPCHRVIQASGQFGGYRWGADRKQAMIGWEAARISC